MTVRRSRIFLICFLALAASSLLVGAEAAYRYRNARRPARAVQLRYYRHARLNRALMRDIDYNGALRINKFGFRGADFDSIKPPRTTRIMVVGASTTFDACAERDSETWPVRLEYWLEQRFPGRNFEVINAGVPGYPMINHVVRLETELFAFEPDIYLVYAGHGIISGGESPDGDVVHTPNAVQAQSAWDSWLRRHSRLYERARPDRAAIRTVAVESGDWSQQIERSVAEFERDLKSFTLIAGASGARVVFAEINTFTGTKSFAELLPEEAGLWQRSYSTPVPVVLEGYALFRSVWDKVAREHGATFIPAATINVAGAENYCPQDPIHFNRAGSETFARRMADELVNAGVLSDN